MVRVFFSLAVLLAVALSVMACVDDEPEVTRATPASEGSTQEDQAGEPDEPAAATAEASDEEQPARVGDTLTFGDGTAATLHGMESPVPGDVFQPDPGNLYFAVDVQVCAGSEEASFNPFFYELALADETRRTPTFGIKEPSLTSGDLQPGDCARGWVTFEVPEGTAPTTLFLDDFRHSGRWQFN